jgi:glycerol-3-phosphate O-acyltransferase/dihydroxyacetone phosphate acyltransferase
MKEKPLGLRFLAVFARLLLGVFFRRVEVAGAEKIPHGRPMVFVGNHVNSLFDPALLLAYLPIAPRFLAKSTLWKHPIVRPFIELASAIPVFRRQDEGVDASKNADTFTRCHEVLRDGGTIAIFPEGRSHDEPALVPLKTGVSRIVLEAEAKYGGIGSCIVPVGLTFDDKTRFRSRALVHVGVPIEPAPEIALYAEDKENAVRSLTARVHEGLEAVTLNYPSWKEARLIRQAAEIYTRPVDHGPAELALGATFPLHQDFIEGYQELLAKAPHEVEAAAAAMRDYADDLKELKLEDAQVASLYPAWLVWGFVGKSLLLLLFFLPLGLLGTLINFLPYQLAGIAARKVAPSPDTLATYKLFASFFLYPLAWLGLAFAAYRAAGPWAALAALAAGPISGLFAVRYHQRQDYFFRQVRAFLLLRSGTLSVAELKQKREKVLAAIRGLVEIYRSAP